MDDETLWKERIGRYVDGAATLEEIHELEQQLAKDRKLRRWYLSYTNVDAALNGSAWTTEEDEQHISSIASFWSRWPAWQRWTLPLAALLALCLGLAQLLQPAPSSTARPIVSLTAATDAVWEDQNLELALRSGEVPAGALRLRSGTAEFLHEHGATILLRGPGTVQFLPKNEVRIEEGKLFCRCPEPKSRLTVITPATTIVDLGTEFAVEARSDRSTRIGVLSGEVKVMTAQPRFLGKGEAAEVRGDGIFVIRTLQREEFTELLLTSPSVSDAVQRGQNLLLDPGFELGTSAETWSGTLPHLEISPGIGRTGGAARISALGHRFWPQCRQEVSTGDISGRVVVATVWAAPNALQNRQCAMVKLVFVNSSGREFAFALRRAFPDGADEARFSQVQVAAYAPEGTRGVQLQLMLSASGLQSGSVRFDDASLVIAPP